MIDAPADIYNQLPLAVEVTTDHKEISAVLRAACDVIGVHGASDFVSIALLHRHFDLSAGTVVAWMNEERQLRLRPVNRATTNVVPVAWRLSPHRQIVPIEYASNELVPPSLRELTTSDSFHNLLKDVFNCLSAVPNGDKFGVTVTPQVFSTFFFGGDAVAASAIVYHETPNEDGSFTWVVPRNSLSTSRYEAIETIWRNLNGKFRVVSFCANCKPTTPP